MISFSVIFLIFSQGFFLCLSYLPICCVELILILIQNELDLFEGVSLVSLKGKLLLAADNSFERDKWIDMLQKSKRMLVLTDYT